MAQLNKVYLMGNLTRDPELRRLPTGTAVVDLGLALNRSFTGKDGNRRDEVTYIDVTVWDRQAETCAEYLRKGRPVHIEGYLKMDEWQDKTTNEKRTKLKVQAERVQFLGSRDEMSASNNMGGGGGGDDDYSPPPARERGPDRGADRDRESSAPPRRAPERSGGGDRGGSRGYGAPPSPAPSRRPPAVPAEPDHDEDDIPF